MTNKEIQTLIDRYLEGETSPQEERQLARELQRDNLCAEELVKMDFPGYSIGGTSIGEPKEKFFEMVEFAIKYLPQDKPRYVMGIGSIDYVLGSIERGVDMFDCVLPTRLFCYISSPTLLYHTDRHEVAVFVQYPFPDK